MSKSLGNGISPQEIVNEWGADALRYLSASIGPGIATAFLDKELVAGKRFINKILNASNFVFMNLEDYDGKKKPKKLEKIDQVFLTRLGRRIEQITEEFEKYELSKVRAIAEDFFWHDFTDNYLEIVKKRVYQGKGDKRLSAQYTLYKTLLTLIKLFAPITPFITEEIYQNYFKKFEKEKSIHLSLWPKPEGIGQKKLDKLYLFNSLVELIGKIRQEKSKAKKAMNSEIILTLEKQECKFLKDLLEDLKDVMNIKEIKQGKFQVEFI
jgi:valyl-tRNA synthetase